MINVTTRSYSNYRDGANLNETTLTQASIRQKGVSLLRTLNMQGDLRGSEGQPLVVHNVIMRDMKPHNLHLQCTMGNYIYCWDDDTGQLMWTQYIGNPVKGSRSVDMFTINDNWGILSTPVIDDQTNIMYFVSMNSQDSLIGDSTLYFHAVSIIDGSEIQTPISLANAAYHDPITGKISLLKSVARKQRCALAMHNYNGFNVVFICCGSFNEDADTNQGWVIAVEVISTQTHYVNISAAWTTISKYSGSGIWMAGQGPAIDDNGYIYIMTGNGSFDNISDFGESFCKLEYKNDGDTSSLQINNWFTPFTDTGRVGGDATLADTSLLPKYGNNTVDGGASNMDDPHDQDLNSGGPLLLPMAVTGYSKNAIVGAGKDGILYVIDMDNMGKSQLVDFAPDKIANNYAKLLAPPYGFTYYPGNMNLMPTNLSQLVTTLNGFTHHQHSTPIYYNSPKYGPMLITMGENSPLRAFKFNADFTCTYLGSSIEIASPNCANNPPGGMPGGMLTLSANGKVANTGLIHCLLPYGDANKQISPGRYLIYSADNIVDGIIEKLWDSADWNHQFKFNKFNIATVADGRIRFCDYSGNILVYG